MRQVKEFKLEGKLKGISDSQLQQHRDVLYKGYVDKLNLIEKELETVSTEGANGTYSPYRELKKEEPFTANAIALHELYFGNLGGPGGPATGKAADIIDARYGSFDKFKTTFKAAGMSARGWVVLCWNFNDDSLHSYTMDMHDIGGVFGCAPLLVLDVYEHAYMVDYGVKRAPYLDAFFENINWDAVNKRAAHVPV
jgi:superoxide dismutase, Fe-Mn family